MIPYEKHGAKPGKRFGLGVARVYVQPDRSLKVDRVMVSKPYAYINFVILISASSNL